MVRPSIALLIAILVVAAGCSGNREPDPITDSAMAVSVSDGALEKTGFSQLTADRPRFTTSGQASISGDVQMNLRYQFNASTRRVVYGSTDSPPRVFAVWAVPLIEPEDVALTVDPLRDMGLATRAERAQDRYDRITSVEPASSGNLTARFLGTDVQVARYSATASRDGSETAIRLAAVTVTHDGDVVTAVFISPTGSVPPETIRSLLTAVQH